MKKSFLSKKIVILLGIATLGIGFVACGGNKEADNAKANAFNLESNISVISREDGSGTRGAFTELFEIIEKTDSGKKDMTTKEAIIAKQTDTMMTNVAGDKYAIGYISLGSLNDTVKAVTIGGAEATAENVKNGLYIVSRPFNIATKGEAEGLTKDFINFILSQEGQKIVASKYISVDSAAPAYVGEQISGKIVIAGSSSVTPIMEKLKEAYILVNPNANIEIQQSDSSAGMMATINGTANIGMSSRELKDSEIAELNSLKIALDGIAIIVNNENPVTNLNKEEVKNIFTGKTLKWSEIK